MGDRMDAVQGGENNMNKYKYLCLMLLLPIKGMASGIPVVDAASLVQSIQQTLHAATQIQNQIQSLEMQAKSLKNLGGNYNSDINFALNQLASLINTTNSLSYSSEQLAEKLGLYQNAEYYRDNPYGTARTYDRYRSMSNTTIDSVKGAMSAAGLQHEQMSNELAYLQQLTVNSDTAVGQTQALQAGNRLATNQVEHLQKLRQLVMSQIQMDAAVKLQEAEEEAMRNASTERALQSNIEVNTEWRSEW